MQVLDLQTPPAYVQGRSFAEDGQRSDFRVRCRSLTALAGSCFLVRAGSVSRLVASMNGRVRPRALSSPDALAEPVVLAAFRVDRPPLGSLCIRTMRYPWTKESPTNSRKKGGRRIFAIAAFFA